MTGIDVDPAAGHIYWSVANGIYRANLDGTGVTGVITSGLSAVEAIALDTAAGQMYWIQSNANKVKINRAKLDGTSQAVLVDDTFGSSFNQNARDLEIDTRAGRLYFTSDLNGAGAIDIVGAVNTDGTNARTLYTSLTTPYGLAINLNDGRLYWADSTGINQGTFTGDASSVVYPNLTGITEIEIPAFVEDRVGTFDADRTISVVPLVDTYEPSRLRYLSASIPPTSVNTTTGTITWSNIGPINADAMKTIYVSFEVLEPASNASGVSTVNTADVTNAVFANGLPASNDQSSVTVAINPTASIGDQVWRELNSNTTYTAGTDAPLPGVKVELRDSSGSSVLATTYTDSSGKYLFSGLVVPEGTLGGAAGTATYQVWVTAPAGATCIYDATHTGGGSCDGKSTVTLSNAYTSLASNPGPTDNLNQDVGYTLPNSLVYGNVWRDYNADGTRATLDPGIGSVTVRLMNGSTVVATTTTDSQGRYSFTNVATGSYTVEVLTSSLPSSGTWTQTAENDATINNSISVSIASAGIYGAHDFGYGLAGTASVGDEVFIDLDQDNVKDAVDEGIPNISLSIYLDTNRDGVLDPTVDPVVKTTSTNSSGIYGFSGLTSGSYIVVLDTSDADFPAGLSAVSDNPKSFSVLEGQSLTNVDFGFFPGDLGSISGQVWHDLDLDATPDGSESGLPSVLVSLYVDLNGDGTFQLLSTTSSSSTGGYSFTGLPYASYRVVVDTADADLPTSDGRVYSATTDSLYLRTLSSASPSATVNFGFAGLPAIGDFVYYDANRSGSQDAFESGIGGVTVRLFADANLDGVADGAALATTTTATGSGSDPVGFYQFTNVDPGNYLVVVDTATLPYSMVNSGDPDRDGVPWLTSADTTADYPASDSRDTGIVLSYSTYTGADFGYVPRGTIGDRVWRDQNANGVVDAGEVGIGGVTVTATSGAQTFTTTTDADGYYAFANLSAGTWTVSISGSPLSGLAATYDADGGLDSSTSVTIDGTGAVTNAFGSLGVDFGLRLNGSYSLSGSVCSNDARTSGICDDVDNLLDDQSDGDVGATDETELSGQTVYLYQKVSSTYRLVATTTTDETGDYRFENLPDGDYKVVLSATSVELQNTQLTTTAADTPATVITDLGTSVVQEVAISGADVTGVDFAFDSLVSYDFGDLPAYYVATTRDVDGARHIIPVGSTLYLGTSRDADIDGVASLDASFDDGSGTDDEDGVVPLNIGSWTNGTAGGSVQVTVPSGSTGYLVGWIDFNHDGSLIDLGELVISQSVTGTGSAQTIAFDIPAGTITNLADESWLARFRLFPAAPAYPLFAYTGEASDGEVEDHLFQRFLQSSLGDRVWLDADADGVQDSGEWGIPGITVVLKDGSGNVLDTQVTGDGSTDVDGDGVIDAVGYYRFDGRTAGTYTVELTIPSKYAATYDPDNGTASPNGSATHVLTSNTHDTNVDFGLNAPVLADISGTVYFDANHDNAFGSGDTGLGAVTVQLWTDPNGDGDPSDGELVNEVLTRTDGSYRFEDMPAYSYVVVEVDPEDYVSDSDVAGAPTDNRIPVVLGVVDVTGRNFLDDGDVLHAIRGTVYNDNGVGVSTNNQFNAADTALAGVTVTLYLDADGDGVVGATDPSVDTQVTASNGGYSFPYLPDGNYLVVESDPTGFSSDDDTQGAGTDNLIAVTLAGADSTGNNFLDDEPTVAISGTVFNDNGTGASANNAFDATDTPIAGVTVKLYQDVNADGQVDNGDTLLATATTDANGDYSFTGLYPGDYLVVETDPTGFVSDDDTDGSATDNLVTVALSASDSTGNDFLDDEPQMTISGSVFNDNGTGASSNNAFNAADTRIPGVTLTLYADVNADGLLDANDTQLATATTDSNGDYSFTSLYAGRYLVVETDPSGFVSDSDTQGSGTDNQIAVTLSVGNSTGNNFLDDEPLVTISGTVWNDEGIGASTEDTIGGADTAIAGVTIKLYEDTNQDGALDANDLLLATTTTDSNGEYSFTGLYPGDYFVSETDPAGLVSNDDVQGSATDNLIALTVAASDSTGNDFLDDEPLMSISGNVLNDEGTGASVDDTFSASDTAIVGVTVELYRDVNSDGQLDANDVLVATATTDSNGEYSFTGLYAGDYLIVETDPTGLGSDNDTQGVGTDNLIAVTLSTSDSTGNDFLDDEPLMSIGGTVWNDEGTGASADDTFSAGDTVIVGATVKLYEDTNQDGALDAGDVLVATATTDSNGDYIFTGLPIGDYLVVETDPTGFVSDDDTDGSGTDNLITVTLSSSDSTGNDFLDDEQVMTIRGTVFNDNGIGASANDAFNAADTRISGVTLKLYLDVNADGQLGSGDTLLATVATDSNGDYSFTGLYAGRYLVVETDPTGFGSDNDTQGVGTDNLIAVALSVGDSTGNDFLDDEQSGPVAVNDARYNLLPGPATLRSSSNDSDPNNLLDIGSVDLNPSSSGRQITLVVPNEGTWKVDNLGWVTFFPQAGFTLDPTPIPYTIRNTPGAVSNQATITLDYAPRATNDSSFGNAIGTAVTLAVVGNDLGGDTANPTTVKIHGTTNPGDPLVVPGQGTWSVNSTTGAITFTPQTGFTGDPQPIRYTVKDYQGNDSNAAVVTVDYVAPCTGFPLMLAIDDLSTPGIDHIVVDDSPVGTSTSLGPSNRLDAAATARGQLSFSGNTAKFSFVKIVATSKPFLTLNGGPDIQITASFRSSASGQIAVRATDGCYAVTAGSPYTMFSPIGGTTNGRVVFRETANGSNLPFATTGVTNNYTTPVAGSFSAGPNRSALFSAPYVSLTKQLNVTHSKANQLTTLTAGGKLVESRLAAEYRSQLAWALARPVFARPEWIWGIQSLVSRGLPLPTVAGVLPGGPRQVEAITTAVQPPVEEPAMSHSASEKLTRNAALAVDQVMGVWGDLGGF